jgi:hypothetical protein
MSSRTQFVVASIAFAVSSSSAFAQTFVPSVRASIQDSPRDGLGDTFNASPFEGLLRQTASTEDRAIQEFNLASLSGATIVSATLSGTVFVNNAFDNGVRTFDFSLYHGNGTTDLTDFQIASTVVGTGSYHPPAQTSFTYSFNVASTLQSLLNGGATFVGLKVDCVSEPNFPNILDDATSQLVVVASACGNVTTYCTAGTTTNSCTPSMSGTGTPDANAGSGFTITASGVEGQKAGILFYGISGQLIQPWATGSSSFLCVKPPTQRTGTQTSGGTVNACDGTLSLDWNAYIAANPTALGSPFMGGQQVVAQGWFRDPPAPKTTNLTDALQFVVCP